MISDGLLSHFMVRSIASGQSIAGIRTSPERCGGCHGDFIVGMAWRIRAGRTVREVT